MFYLGGPLGKTQHIDIAQLKLLFIAISNRPSWKIYLNSKQKQPLGYNMFIYFKANVHTLIINNWW